MFNFDTLAKKRQAHFRKTSPTISQQGRSPWDGQGQKYDYLLGLGCEEENLYPTLRGEHGAARFFKERHINGGPPARAATVPRGRGRPATWRAPGLRA